MPEVKYEVEVSVEVWCGTCGAGLCGTSTAEDYKGVTVEACEKCLKAEYDRGYTDGLEEGDDHHDF